MGQDYFQGSNIYRSDRLTSIWAVPPVYLRSYLHIFCRQCDAATCWIICSRFTVCELEYHHFLSITMKYWTMSFFNRSITINHWNMALFSTVKTRRKHPAPRRHPTDVAIRGWAEAKREKLRRQRNGVGSSWAWGIYMVNIWLICG